MKKTDRFKLRTISGFTTLPSAVLLLALELTGSVSMSAQSTSINTLELTSGGSLQVSTLLSEDIDGDGNLDVHEDLDNDGHFDIFNEDVNGNGVLDPGEDLDGDNRLDLGTEDVDGDGNFDIAEDVNGDGNLDVAEDVDGDGKLDVAEDVDGDGNLDVAEDVDGDGNLDVAEDVDGDGKLDVADDYYGDGNLDVNEDIDGDGNLDVYEDLNGNGTLDTNGEINVAVADATGAATALNIEATELTVNGEQVANQADVDQNELDSDAADLAIQAVVDQNEADSEAADLAIQNDVDQNELDSDAAYYALQDDVDQNKAVSDAADTAIRAEFAAADIADQAYTDAREAAITSAYQAAAANLQAQIDLLAAQIASLAAVDDTASAIPSEINYQGRLTDTNGNPAAGSKEFTLKLYDAVSGGNELYAESIGSVLIDSNGIYSFQFGAHGSSHAIHTETVATANGTDLVYTAALNDTPLEATLSVTDGTYSWNIVDGNTATPAVADAQIVNGFVVGVTLTDFGAGYSSAPTMSISGDGTGATATAFVSDGALTSIIVTSPGSGYSSATVAIDPPTAPFIVNYSDQALEIIYASAPDAGTEISSSYAYLEDGINQALAAGSAHWLELTIDGAVQSPRERILSVPFALTSAQAQKNTKLIQLLEDSIEQLQED